MPNNKTAVLKARAHTKKTPLQAAGHSKSAPTDVGHLPALFFFVNAIDLVDAVNYDECALTAIRPGFALPDLMHKRGQNAKYQKMAIKLLGTTCN